jgi:multimeric flavodoxin WrbA
MDAKANILVAFYSRDGSVEALARAVSEGAREAGAEVRLRRVPDIVPPTVMAHVPGWEERSKRMLAHYGAPTAADAEWADGIIFGTPTRFGNTSAELKAFIDSLGGDRMAETRLQWSRSTFRWRIWGSSSCRTATLTLSLCKATGRRTGHHRCPDRAALRPARTSLKSRSIKVRA